MSANGNPSVLPESPLDATHMEDAGLGQPQVSRHLAHFLHPTIGVHTLLAEPKLAPTKQALRSDPPVKDHAHVFYVCCPCGGPLQSQIVM